MRTRIVSLLALLGIGGAAFAADTLIKPGIPGHYNFSDKMYLQGPSGERVPAVVAMTTDGSGGIVPISFSGTNNITVGAVDQGAPGVTGSPWHVRDDAWISDFDAWKTWANVNLSTRASESTLSALNAKVTAVDTGAVVVASSSLPTGAASESTLAGIKTGTDKIPASPSQEHATAGSPHATRLSDGSAFYKATTPSDTQPISHANLDSPLSGLKTDTAAIASSTAAISTSAASGVTNQTSGGQKTQVVNSSGTEIGGAIKTDLDKIPADPAREGGNLASILVSAASGATSAASGVTNQTNGAQKGQLVNSSGTEIGDSIKNNTASTASSTSTTATNTGTTATNTGTTATNTGTIATNTGTTATNTGTVATNTATIASNQTSGGAKVQQVDASGNVQPAGATAASGVFTRAADGSGNAETSTLVGSARSKDVNVTQIAQSSDRTATAVLTVACADASIDACGAGSTAEISTQGSATAVAVTPDLAHGGTDWVGTVVMDGTYNGTNWFVVKSYDTRVNDTTTQNYCKDFTVWGNSLINDPWVVPSAGMLKTRLRFRTKTSGSVTTTLTASQGLFLCTPSNAAVSLGNSTSKTNVMTPGSLVTTATTADQVALTYTVTSGKTLFLQSFETGATRTTFATTTVEFGTCSLESPAGTKLWTQDLTGPGQAMAVRAFAEPLVFASGTVVRIVCTPAATNSQTWLSNFIGYEK